MMKTMKTDVEFQNELLEKVGFKEDEYDDDDEGIINFPCHFSMILEKGKPVVPQLEMIFSTEVAQSRSILQRLAEMKQYRDLKAV